MIKFRSSLIRWSFIHCQVMAEATVAKRCLWHYTELTTIQGTWRQGVFGSIDELLWLLNWWWWYDDDMMMIWWWIDVGGVALYHCLNHSLRSATSFGGLHKFSIAKPGPPQHDRYKTHRRLISSLNKTTWCFVYWSLAIVYCRYLII